MLPTSNQPARIYASANIKINRTEEIKSFKTKNKKSKFLLKKLNVKQLQNIQFPS